MRASPRSSVAASRSGNPSLPSGIDTLARVAAAQPTCSYCARLSRTCVYVEGDLRKQRPSKRRRKDPPPPPSPQTADETSINGPRRASSAAAGQSDATTAEDVASMPPLQGRASPPLSGRAAMPPTPPLPPLPTPSASSSHLQQQHAPAQQHQQQRRRRDQIQHQENQSLPGQPGQHRAPPPPPQPPDPSQVDATTQLFAQPAPPLSSHILPDELIEALSGKVAWFDELERNSNTSSANELGAAGSSNAHASLQPSWSNAADVAALDPMLADLLQPSTTPRRVTGKERVIQLHYFRSFGGATAVTQGLKKISVRIRVPAELESMLLEAQNRSTLFDPASSSLDPQSLDLHALLGTSRMVPSHPATASEASPSQGSGLFASMASGQGAAWTPPAATALHEDLPDPPLRDLLLKRFFLHLGDHFPFISQATLERQLAEGKRVNPALVHAMCALSARFAQPHELDTASPGAASTPAASAHLSRPSSLDATTGSCSKPHSRGLPFAERAKSYVMSSITCPSVTTVATLVLLAWHEFAVNAEGGLWMFAGMALRMAIDLGLHRRVKKHWLAPSSPAGADAGDLIQRQPLFWCVFALDRLLSIGTGRPTSLKDSEINLEFPPLTVSLPAPTAPTGRRADLDGGSGSGSGNTSRHRPSVFGHLTRLMQKAGTLAEIANNLGDEDDQRPLEELDRLEAAMIGDYDALPPELVLGVEQLRQSSEPRCLLSLHLWFHNLLILLNRLPLSRLRASPVSADESREILRHASAQIRNAVLYADAVDPTIHLACPFTNQAFCLAGGVEVGMAATLQQHRQAGGGGNGAASASARASAAASRTAPSWRNGTSTPAIGPGARSLFVQAHLDAYQRCVDALDRLTERWLGVSWIANALKARKMEEAGGENGGVAGAGAGGETMLSHSELKVLLRLAASTASSTEQPISIIDDPSSAGASSSSGQAQAQTAPRDAAAPSWVSSATTLSNAAFACFGPAEAPPTSLPAVSTSSSSESNTSISASAPQPPPSASALHHISISDISHPDDLSQFLPFLSHHALTFAASSTTATPR
ncbi:uncharacterized protein PSFLO_06885 [Pseudozyma flocculosa]|uniref:Xylanolytic transcriptional activator regulatory domain-containing protein n=1 Tax=Pseudozyma flocculosa TaxID=84751 RepID=A0A5C3FAB4_9BASI|nr:uncharacterized protein PSFLO_06885 [Pseudozyma flocculosa]